MPSYSYSISTDQRTITFTVTGLAAGDLVFFYVRHSDKTENLAPTSSYTATGSTMTQSFTVLEPNSNYTVNVTAKGEFLGAQTFSTGTAPGDRPENWSWSGIIYPSAPFENLTADIWNDFTARINEFRAYKSQKTYAFTRARSGVTDVSECVTEAMDAIRGTTGHGALPSSVTIDADTWIQLADALNAVP